MRCKGSCPAATGSSTCNHKSSLRGIPENQDVVRAACVYSRPGAAPCVVVLSDLDQVLVHQVHDGVFDINELRGHVVRCTRPGVEREELVLRHILERACDPVAIDCQLERLRSADGRARSRWTAVAVVTAERVAVEVAAVAAGAVIAETIAQPVVRPCRRIGCSRCATRQPRGSVSSTHDARQENATGLSIHQLFSAPSTS